MTTIAYRDGVIAGDTLACWGTSRDGFAVKVRKRGRLLAGASGSLAPVQRFLDWFSSGLKGDPPEMPGGDDAAFGVIIDPDDHVLLWGPHGWERTQNPTVTMGSGSQFAEGAMAMGATAEQAVRVAMLFDTKSGGEVTVLRR